MGCTSLSYHKKKEDVLFKLEEIRRKETNKGLVPFFFIIIVFEKHFRHRDPYFLLHKQLFCYLRACLHRWVMSPTSCASRGSAQTNQCKTHSCILEITPPYSILPCCVDKPLHLEKPAKKGGHSCSLLKSVFSLNCTELFIIIIIITAAAIVVMPRKPSHGPGPHCVRCCLNTKQKTRQSPL